MSTAEKQAMTPAEYLAIERQAETRNEFYQGEIFAMTGASRRHNLITSQLSRSLLNQLDNGPCEVYIVDMRVKVRPTGLYTYPDISVVCGEAEFEDDQIDTLLNPAVIVEVLSDSTEAYDRGKKFEHYRNLESLQHYVLVSQTEMHVERFTRREDGTWLLWEAGNPDDVLELAPIDFQVTLAEIYAKIDFEQAEG